MNYIIFFIFLIISIELIIKSNYLFLVSSLIKLSVKSKDIILNKKISDHWKEKIITQYSFNMMKLSINMLLVLIIIFALFYFTDIFFKDFKNFVISLRGLIYSIFFGFFYISFRNRLKK